MDISIIKPEMVTDQGLVIGNPNAKAVMKAFINLKCPYCKKWYTMSQPILAPYLDAGKLKLVLKLYDKEKEDLITGNYAQHHLPYDQPEKAYAAIGEIFKTRDEWGELSETEVDNFITQLTDLPKQPEHIIEAKSQFVIDEAKAAVIQFVPTIILGDHIFDESISPEQLKEYLEAATA